MTGQWISPDDPRFAVDGSDSGMEWRRKLMDEIEPREPRCGEEAGDIAGCEYRYKAVATNETAPVCTLELGCFFKRRVPLSELSRISSEVL